MNELRANLGMPVIGGDIVAYRKDLAFKWRVEFVCNGPDARYKPAIVSLTPVDTDKLRKAMKEAYRLLTKLGNDSFTGSYSQAVGRITNPGIEVISDNGKAWINFWLSNGRWRFSRRLMLQDVTTVIEVLEMINQKGEELTDRLYAISKKKW